MITSIDFTFYPKLSEKIEKFIEVSTAFDVRDVILGNEKIVLNDEKYKTASELFIHTLKSDEIYKRYEEYKNNKLQSNGVLPYLMLYDMLKEEQEILLGYISEIENLS